MTRWTKPLIGLLIAVCLLGATEAKTMIDDIHWLGHDGFRITGKATIYIDPYAIETGPVADLILITHPHTDHCSAVDIAKVQGPNTILVGTADALEKLEGTKQVIKVGSIIKLRGVTIQAVPAYNNDKTYHPKSKRWIGYLLTVDGIRIYHAGDTDHIPEMKSIRADIALLPVGGKYTMTAEDAVKAALDIRPKFAIPIHYGSVIGTEEDACRFKDGLLGKIEVVMKKREQ